MENPSFATIYYEPNANKMYYTALILSARQAMGRSNFLATYTLTKVEDYGQAGTRVNRDPGYAPPTAENLSQLPCRRRLGRALSLCVR